MANGLLLRLRERELSASPAERNVIAYVSAHPHEVVGLSVRGLEALDGRCYARRYWKARKGGKNKERGDVIPPKGGWNRTCAAGPAKRVPEREAALGLNSLRLEKYRSMICLCLIS